MIGCCIPKHNNNDEIPLDDEDNLNHYEVILIRIYGKNTEVLIDRKKEIENFKSLHKYGFAPKLLATFSNGLAYEFSNGKPLSKSDVYEEHIWRRIAQRMAEMHRDICAENDGLSLSQSPVLWSKIYKMFNLIPTKYSNPMKQQRYLNQFFLSVYSVNYSYQKSFFITFVSIQLTTVLLKIIRREELLPPIDELRNEFDRLYAAVSKINSPVVFAHNDLLLGNILHDPVSENKVTFIDYEYADYNFQAYDIGNHFAEFAGNAKSTDELQ